MFTPTFLVYSISLSKKRIHGEGGQWNFFILTWNTKEDFSDGNVGVSGNQCWWFFISWKSILICHDRVVNQFRTNSSRRIIGTYLSVKAILLRHSVGLCGLNATVHSVFNYCYCVLYEPRSWAIWPVSIRERTRCKRTCWGIIIVH